MIKQNCNEGRQMSEPDAENTFILVKDSRGNKYLCPIIANRKTLTGRPDKVDDCIEEEVVGRYAGHLNRKPS